MTPTEIREAVARLIEAGEKATPGPWYHDSYGGIVSTPLARTYDKAVAEIPEDAPESAYDHVEEPFILSVPEPLRADDQNGRPDYILSSHSPD